MVSKQVKSKPFSGSGRRASQRERSRKSNGTAELPSGNLAARVCLWIGRALALGLLAFAPWMYGMVTWTMQTWLVPWVGLILLFALAATFLESRALHASKSGQTKPSASRSLSPVVWGLALLLAMALLQTLPLPESLWRIASPGAAFDRQVTELSESYVSQISERKPLQIEGLSLPAEPVATSDAPRTLSIHPLQTRASASVFAAVIATLIACGILFRDRLGTILLLSFIAITALLITLLGLFQSVVWNGWMLLDMPTEHYFATFVSRNSAPQFIAIGMGAAIGLLVAWSKAKSGAEAEKRYNVRYPAINVMARTRRRLEDLLQDLDALSLVLVFSITIMLVGVIAAASRGGILAVGFATIVTLGMTLGKHRSGLLRSAGILVLVGFVSAILLVTFELDTEAFDRMDSISAEAYQLSNGRLDVWAMAVSNTAYWLSGCGLGTFHFGILPSYAGDEAVWFYHAENVYIELFAEFGILGFLVGIASIGWLCWQMFVERKKSKRNELLFSATLFAVSAVALQSLVDFSLIIPAVFLPLAALVGVFINSADSNHNLRHKGHPRHRSRRHEGEHSAEPDGSVSILPPKFWHSPHAFRVCLVLTAVGLVQGYPSLLGFAKGEQLEKVVENWGKDQAPGVLPAMPDISISAAELAHPEVALQLGRLEQKVFSARLLASASWPETITDRLRKWLASPETTSAAMRGGVDGKLAGMADLLTLQNELAAQLAATSQRMRLAVAACPLDWRASWGLLRSDMGQLDAVDRSRSYARIALTTKHLPRLQQSIATNALWAGETQIGIDLWRRTLAANPTLSSTVVALVSDQLIDADGLQQLLPKSMLVRAEFAQSLSEQAKVDANIVESILDGVTIEELRAECTSSSDWVVAAWLAQRRDDYDSAIEAYRQAEIRSPMNYGLRYERAKLLESQGRKDEAIDAMEAVVRRAPLNDEYKNFLDALKNEAE